MADEINVNENPESMFIDTDSFDFLELDDVKADTNELGYNTKQTGKDLMDDEDIADLGEVEDEVDEDELPPEEGDEEDEVDEDEAEDAEEADAESDEEEVDFEGYEVTLPDGETVVLSEAIKGYKNAKQLEADKAEFTALQEEFASKSAGVTKYLELAKLEAERVIEDYDDFDWASYKKDDPVGYVENREFLDRYKARRQEIVDAMADVQKEKEVAEAAEFQKKAQEAGTILARDIPGWNNDMYQQLMMYAVENGADADDIANTVDPVIFKILHKAMQYEKGKQVVKAKVKKLGSPKKVVKASAKPVTHNGANAGKKAIIKKMETGNYTENDLSNTFNFLED